MSALLYQDVFLYVMLAWSAITVLRLLRSHGYLLQEKGDGFLLPLVCGVTLTLWLGLRPVHYAFGDTVNYAQEYADLELSTVAMDWGKEWIWQWLMITCKAAGMSVNGFFLLVEAGYVFSSLWAIKVLFPRHTTLGSLFMWCSLMWFSFSVNGLRNGLACHFTLLGMALWLSDKKLPAIALVLGAFGIHRSVALPLMAFALALWGKVNVPRAIGFWVTSIILSLVAGGRITDFFSSMGFDERMTSYTNADNDMNQFSRTGFRWDFLLYSAMPIWMAWYVCVKRKAKENWYNALAVTYILSNAFWVMVIRSSFSNRFAYLSWFLYPVIIAYPLIWLPLWRNQDNRTGIILSAYCAFSAFMLLVYW